jgi:hypothetical protein
LAEKEISNGSCYAPEVLPVHVVPVSETLIALFELYWEFRAGDGLSALVDENEA